ncbi:putative late blight resistance protein homolog R1B-8 isoform X2 [Salvia miltiorrhiza]|uniref:putative late blight resistance protein homolog R1B-8 isoform X2 n=1 Tax=Salvia miltiorrhiza TaxID=226208 RepID=UPI0025ABA93E|nr:putative late blight resistance protein homolog R1B-8 isoform X2 [Salvia miltiorrhiza]
MAYEALDNLQQTLDQILNHGDERVITPSVKQEIISIRIQAVVLQLNVKHYPNKETITEAANSTHEIIEYLFSEENVPDGESIDPTVRLANRLREVAQRLESTVGDVVDYIKGNDPISSVTDSPDVSSSSRSAITSSKDDDVVGFEEDVEVIKDRLCMGSSRLQVIPIVGTGGIGKTTLAKILYNDSLIRKEFSICGWVTISQDHSVERIVSNLLASIKEISALRDAKSDIPIETLICEYLKGRRYLIVMDDMWSKKAWDDVKMLFPDVGHRSRIIVTTRLQDVAAYVDSSNFIYTIRLLDAHHSWKLLKRKVFGHKDIPIELEDIGKKIVKNCGGLPLSIVVVGGLLSKIHTRYSWKQIAANGGQLETIIGLSYTHLPNHSKPCLLYMGGFPEDYEIRVSELIHLWIAEGIVTLSNGSKSLEEEAEDCFDDLVERSLVLVINRKFDGKIKSCSLHDIVREFCVKEAAKEKVILSVMDYLPTPILRSHFVPRLIKDHHSISASSYDLHLKDYVHSSHIRTIICTPKKGYRSVGFVEKFSSVRVLHVLRRNDHWDWEPGQVFDLVHLTYLASNIPNSIVPSAISRLQNLQTLVIYRSEVRLPMEIWRLRHLRHLIAFSFQPLPNPEGENNPLENLQELSLATDLVCSKRMVEMIPNIKKLGICYSMEKFDADAGYHFNNLKYLCRLEKLKLEMRRGISRRQLLYEMALEMRGGFSFRQFLDEMVLMRGGGFSFGQLLDEMAVDFAFRLVNEKLVWTSFRLVNKILGWTSFGGADKRLGGLNFPLLLRRLTLSGWMLPWRDMAIVGSLPNLQVLKLRNYACKGKYWQTSNGEFRELRLLLIDRSDLVYWGTAAHHFPKLECLTLRRCHGLDGIPREIGDIHTLELIEVDEQSTRLLLSAEKIQKKQRDSGKRSFLVRVKRS